ncbi:hypothetical protein ACJMK2_006481 [Sinanodonta woodiana]|uniref:Rab3 GTPase-activating protein catalytic subunit n=1 Tax=Sinanodonta woodiana TaxID=1069815 RepID=A0ABD3VTA5_SINWO
MAADDDGEVFEITDFTTASEWERFIARVEEILHEWKLVNCEPKPPAKKGEYANGVWEEQTEELSFADFQFCMTHIWLKQPHEDDKKQTERETAENETEEEEQEDKTATVFLDLQNMDNDFPSRAHCICRWYGLQEFVTLMPAVNEQPIDTESRVKLLLSSVSIALSNAGCSVPFFAQIQQRWQKLYMGTCIMPGATVEFKMVALKRIPHQYSHLTGLLDVFKTKLGHAADRRPPVYVTVRFMYVLQDWINSPWTQSLPGSTEKSADSDLSSSFDEEVGCSSFEQLPFGACDDPVTQLHLSCTWPMLSEDIVVETQHYSDLDPRQAPHWSVRVQMADDPQCLLGEYLEAFLQLCKRKESWDQVIGNLQVEEETEKNNDISQALQKLTEPSVSYSLPALGSYMTQAATKHTRITPKHLPLSQDVINQIIFFLFPDASKTATVTKEKDSEKVQSGKEEQESPTAPHGNVKELPKQLKSAPVGSLLHHLSVCLCVINQNYSGLHAVGQVWQEFLLELRYRWDYSYIIDEIERGPPNLGTCLLYQKLQMLNCCIERKIKREQLHKGYTGEPDSPINSSRDKSTASSSTYNSALSQPGGKGEVKTDDSSGSRKNPKKVQSFDSSSEDEFFECEEENDTVKEKDNQSEIEEESLEQSETEMEAVDEPTIATETADQSVDSEKEVKVKGSPIATETADQSVDSEKEEKAKVSSAINSKTEDDTLSVTSESSYTDSVTHRPEGRLAPHGELKLLHNGEQMYIPVTQEPAPMTEDMLDEHAEVLAKLGTSTEGAQLRARMQSACLLSDMESFKAANPGCALEDFVRWYSPRDWIEDEVEGENVQTVIKGHLSQRMEIPGNMWVEVWQTARPVPARRQKRLFDDTKEAEKVLHFLSSLKPADVVLHLLPVLTHAAILKVMEKEDQELPVLQQLLDKLCSKASIVTRSPVQDVRSYEELFRMISHAEIVIARNQSLRSKFTADLLDQKDAENELRHFVNSILKNSEVTVRGGPRGPAGTIIYKLFIAAQKASYMVLDEDSAQDKEKDREFPKHEQSFPDFPRPSAREYILRTVIPRPAPYSKPLPQRMHCVLCDNDFRLAGAFSSDSVFQ